MAYDYNIVIIGGGAAGLVSAIVGSALKAKVALIEKDEMGGDCLNTGCVPSKALIKSAKVVHQIRNAHKYEDRAEEILDVVLNSKDSTFSADELRKKSLTNLSVSTKAINKLRRSFIIPVLDYSPESEFSIRTLLEDLQNIEGNVIVIFNSTDVAEEMKDHPRIDFYSVMSHNVGVARAWNVGLNMVQTPITFIGEAE